MCLQERGRIERLAPRRLHPHDVSPDTACHLAHPLAEEAVHTYDDRITGIHQVHEGSLHPCRSRAGKRQREVVRGGEDLAEAVAGLIE